MCAWNGEEIWQCGKIGREKINTCWEIYTPEITSRIFILTNIVRITLYSSQIGKQCKKRRKKNLTQCAPKTSTKLNSKN